MQYQSEQLDQLAGALAKAQAQMQKALTDKSNPFYKSKYADYNSVRDAVIGPLTENEISYSHLIGVVDNMPCLITILMHSSGQWIKSCFPMPETKNDSQSRGSAISYLKRYSLSAMTGCAIGNAEDDDGEKAMDGHRNQKKEEPKKEEKTQVSPMKKLYTLLGMRNVECSKIPDFLKAKATEANTSIEQVAESAIKDNLIGRFIESYQKFCEE